MITVALLVFVGNQWFLTSNLLLTPRLSRLVFYSSSLFVTLIFLITCLLCSFLQLLPLLSNEKGQLFYSIYCFVAYVVVNGVVVHRGFGTGFALSKTKGSSAAHVVCSLYPFEEVDGVTRSKYITHIVHAKLPGTRETPRGSLP